MPTKAQREEAVRQRFEAQRAKRPPNAKACECGHSLQVHDGVPGVNDFCTLFGCNCPDYQEATS